MTSRFAKPLLSMIAVLAAFAVGALVFPSGAVGSQRPADVWRDITAINRSVTITEPVDGNVQVFGGDVIIAAPVSGRVVVLGGNVELRGEGRVDGDLVCIAGEVRWPNRGSVQGNVYAPRNGYESVEAGELIIASMREPFSLLTLALEMSLLFVWLVVAVVMTLTNSREIRASSLELRATPLHSFILGLVAFTSFVLTAVVFSYLIPYFVGLLLLAALMVFAVIAKVYGMVAVFHAAGTLLAGPRTSEQLARRRLLRGDLAMVIVGFLVLGALRLIPYIGPAVWMTASAMAVGVALATKFGRREPWFLTWRPAEA